jgi:hypothetical protein
VSALAGRGLARTASWVTERAPCSAAPTCVRRPRCYRAYECCHQARDDASCPVSFAAGVGALRYGCRIDILPAMNDRRFLPCHPRGTLVGSRFTGSRWDKSGSDADQG